MHCEVSWPPLRPLLSPRPSPHGVLSVKCFICPTVFITLINIRYYDTVIYMSCCHTGVALTGAVVRTIADPDPRPQMCPLIVLAADHVTKLLSRKMSCIRAYELCNAIAHYTVCCCMEYINNVIIPCVL